MISLTCLKACVDIVILCSLHRIHAVTASCWFFSAEHTPPKIHMEPENRICRSSQKKVWKILEATSSFNCDRATTWTNPFFVGFTHMERTSLNDQIMGILVQLLMFPYNQDLTLRKPVGPTIALKQPESRSWHTGNAHWWLCITWTPKNMFIHVLNTVYLYKGMDLSPLVLATMYHQSSSKSHQSPLSTVEGWGTHLKLQVISIISEASVWRNLPSKKITLKFTTLQVPFGNLSHCTG